jgi:hypothetical protein
MAIASCPFFFAAALRDYRLLTASAASTRTGRDDRRGVGLPGEVPKVRFPVICSSDIFNTATYLPVHVIV